MSLANERPNTALLVIDVQNDVVAAAHDREAVIANVGQVVAAARASDTPVIWVQHDDEYMLRNTPGWEIVAELMPQPGELQIFKNHRSSFEATPLDQELAERQIGRLIVTGSQTDYCVRWTLHGALELGYDTVLVGDAHTTDAASSADMPSGAQIVAHLNSTWGSQAHPTATTSVLAAEELVF